MFRRPGFALVALVATVASPACGEVDLSKSLTITDVLSGWYDNGLNPEGKTQLLPSVTFKLKNVSEQALASVDLTISYWQEGADGEKDSALVTGIGGTALPSGASTEALTVRPAHGYTLEGARADFFQHSGFKDFTAKVFGKHGGRIYKLGEVKLDRVIIPHAQKTSGRP